MNMPWRALMLVMVVMLAIVSSACTSTGGSRFSEASGEEAAVLNTRLGASYMQTGDLKEADEKLRKALDQDPDNADAHATFAILQMRLDKPDVAARHFERALALEPENPEVKNNFGTMLCDQGEYDRAIELFTEAAEDGLYETPAYAWRNAGTCARDAGRTEEAVDYLERALNANPGFGRPLLDLARIEYDNERPYRAADYLERYHEVSRQSARSLWLGVRIERMRDDREAADAFGRDLVRNFPDSDEAEEFLKSR